MAGVRWIRIRLWVVRVCVFNSDLSTLKWLFPHPVITLTGSRSHACALCLLFLFVWWFFGVGKQNSRRKLTSCGIQKRLIDRHSKVHKSFCFRFVSGFFLNARAKHTILNKHEENNNYSTGISKIRAWRGSVFYRYTCIPSCDSYTGHNTECKTLSPSELSFHALLRNVIPVSF